MYREARAEHREQAAEESVKRNRFRSVINTSFKLIRQQPEVTVRPLQELSLTACPSLSASNPHVETAQLTQAWGCCNIGLLPLELVNPPFFHG